jgi:hypothetical protein
MIDLKHKMKDTLDRHSDRRQITRDYLGHSEQREVD